MKFYHVSVKKWKTEFVIKLKPPRKKGSHGEDRTPRLCVAPTVCQCMLGCPSPREEFDYHIYEVLTPRAVPAQGVGTRIRPQNIGSRRRYLKRRAAGSR